MTYEDRYATAIRTANLKSKPDTTRSDSDVLGAGAIAGHALTHREDGSRRAQSPLGMALMRLLMGDNHATREIVDQLAAIIEGRAFRTEVEITRVEAVDMGRAVLAWCRDGVCKTCGGHGFRIKGDGEVGQGRAVLSEHHCRACRGTRKVPFETQFPLERVLLAQFARDKIERELAGAGGAAMAALADDLDL